MDHRDPRCGSAAIRREIVHRRITTMELPFRILDPGTTDALKRVCAEPPPAAPAPPVGAGTPPTWWPSPRAARPRTAPADSRSHREALGEREGGHRPRRLGQLRAVCRADPLRVAQAALPSATIPLPRRRTEARRFLEGELLSEFISIDIDELAIAEIETAEDVIDASIESVASAAAAPGSTSRSGWAWWSASMVSSIRCGRSRC